MGTLDGKGALVTGGSRGIGRAIVKRLAGDGAAVVFSYLSRHDAAQSVADEVSEAGGRAFPVQADQGSLADLRRLTAQAAERLDGLDIVVINAAGGVGQLIDEVTEESYDQYMAVHAKGPFFLIQQAGRMLRGLQDDLWPFPPSPSGLTQALNRRTGWLLTAPLTVDAGEGTAGLLETEIVMLADVIELLLGGLFSAAPPDRALAAVRAGQDLIVLDLTMTAAPGAGEASAVELAVAKAEVGRLAAAVGAGAADVVRHGRRLRVRMDLPRRPQVTTRSTQMSP